jgi:hypothetical protein
LQRTVNLENRGKTVRGRPQRNEVSLKFTRSDIGRKARFASNLDMTVFALTYGGKNAHSNSYHSGVRLVMVEALQPRGSRTQLSHDSRFRPCRLRVLLQRRRAATVGLELQLGQLLCLYPAVPMGRTNAGDLALHPSGVVLTNIVLVAIGAPLFVRAICCAYD